MKKLFLIISFGFGLICYAQKVNISKQNKAWLDDYKAKDFSSFKNHYAEEAYLWSPKDFFSSQQQIENAYAGSKWKITSLDSIFETKAHTKEVLYRVNHLSTQDNGNYLQLLIYQKAKICFEVLLPIDESADLNRKSIDILREKWMRLSNSHNLQDLVYDCYAENALYFNHKPVLEGRIQLMQEYSYMKNPNYTLHLNPIYFEMTSENYALEIGQCSGSYSGKYIIIWEKQTDGKWMVCMDSNV